MVCVCVPAKGLIIQNGQKSGAGEEAEAAGRAAEGKGGHPGRGRHPLPLLIVDCIPGTSSVRATRSFLDGGQYEQRGLVMWLWSRRMESDK